MTFARVYLEILTAFTAGAANKVLRKNQYFKLCMRN